MVSGAPLGLSTRWQGIGRSRGVTLGSVELWTVELPFRRPVRTAQGAHRRRPLLLVRAVGRTRDGTATGVDGWGECAALADTTFDAEDVGGSLAALRDDLVPALMDRSGRDGGVLPPPSELAGLRRSARSAPLAFAALEMAVADAHLRAEHRSLAGLLGVEGRAVEIGAVVGQADATEELVARVGDLVARGYSRVKVKIGPGWDLEPVAALVAAFPSVRFQADANGSYRPADGGHLARLDPFGLLCLEQPFASTELAAHAALAGRVTTPICLDEGLDSPSAVERALAMGACSVVCVKPSRLGGLGAALSVIERCRDSGVPLWMGGMFESGYGRGVNTVLGALEGMSWPGDLSPSREYLEDDLVPVVPSPTGVDQRPEALRAPSTSPLPHRPPPGALASPPTGEGMGPPPTPAALVRYGTGHQVIDGPGD